MRFAIALLSQALKLLPTGAVHLLPAGEFTGRGHEAGGEPQRWHINDTQGQALAAKLNTRHIKTAFQLDYEHQTFNASANGQPAPASGWVNKFEWRTGLGLFGLDVAWTPKARAAIEGDEYRYISPVIKFNAKTGEVTDVVNAALVGIPALDLDPATLAAMQARHTSDSTTPHVTSHHQEPSMTLAEQLRAALGIADASTPDATVLTQVAQLKAAHDRTALERVALCGALGLAADATLVQAATAAAALKTSSAAPDSDATALQAMSALQSQVATLQAQVNAKDVTELVSAAVAQGKILPAQVPWATEFGKANLAQFSAFLGSLPAVSAGLGASQSAAAGTQAAADASALAGLAKEELAMCSALGIKPEDFAKTRALAATAA